ncbi:MAG: hypothetical protein EPN40_12860 [Rhodanobacteraceae bacterium]|nr:MAG: hypothetical protein EPN40_12860 [Rhodanobacteraceae bacterium]
MNKELVALTKRSLAQRLRALGASRSAATKTVAKLTHAERWARLPLHVRAEIRLHCLLRKSS